MTDRQRRYSCRAPGVLSRHASFNGLGSQRGPPLTTRRRSTAQLPAPESLETVKVVVRCRPPGAGEQRASELHCDEANATVFCEDLTGRYEAVLWDQAEQDDVFQHVEPIVEDIIDGYNGTIFAYGVTGSGKTHTMMGSDKLDGVIPQCARRVFERIQARGRDGQTFLVQVSFLEIYNRQIFDLLCSEREPLTLRGESGAAYVEGLSHHPASGAQDVLAILEEGRKNQHFRATQFNDHSSRSHSICTVTVESSCVATNGLLEPQVVRGKLVLVDLAGAENVKHSQVEGEGLREATEINTALSSLGNVIHALNHGLTHIPYRDSKLTRILEDSLGGNSKTVMIAAISLDESMLNHTMATLRFASRVTLVTNAPKINSVVDPKDATIHSYEEEIARLKRELAAGQSPERIYSGSPRVGVDTAELLLAHKQSATAWDEQQSAMLHKLRDLEGALVTRQQAAETLERKHEATVRRLEDGFQETLRHKDHILKNLQDSLQNAQVQMRSALADKMEIRKQSDTVASLLKKDAQRLEAKLEATQQECSEYKDKLQAVTRELAVALSDLEASRSQAALSQDAAVEQRQAVSEEREKSSAQIRQLEEEMARMKQEFTAELSEVASSQDVAKKADEEEEAKRREAVNKKMSELRVQLDTARSNEASAVAATRAAREQLVALDVERTTFKVHVEELTAKLAATTSQAQTAKQSAADREWAEDRLKQQVQLEREAHQRQVDLVRTTARETEEELRRQISMLRGSSNDVESYLNSQLDERRQKENQLQKRIRELESEHWTLTSKVDAAARHQADSSAELERAAAVALQKEGKLRHELASAAEDAKVARAEAGELAQQLQVAVEGRDLAESSKKEMKEQESSFAAEKSALQFELAATAEQAEKHKAIGSQAGIEVKSLRAKLAEAAQRLGEANEAADVERQDGQRAREELQSALERLTAAQVLSKDREAQRVQLVNENTALTESRAGLERELAEHQASAATAAAAAREELSAARGAAADAARRLHAAEEAGAEAEERAAAAQAVSSAAHEKVAMVQDKAAAAQRAVADVTRECQRVEQQMQEKLVEQDDALTEARAELDTAQRQHRELLAALQGWNPADLIADYEGLRDVVARLEAQAGGNSGRSQRGGRTAGEALEDALAEAQAEKDTLRARYQAVVAERNYAEQERLRLSLDSRALSETLDASQFFDHRGKTVVASASARSLPTPKAADFRPVPRLSADLSSLSDNVDGLCRAIDAQLAVLHSDRNGDAVKGFDDAVAAVEIALKGLTSAVQHQDPEISQLCLPRLVRVMEALGRPYPRLVQMCFSILCHLCLRGDPLKRHVLHTQDLVSHTMQLMALHHQDAQVQGQACKLLACVVLEGPAGRVQQPTRFYCLELLDLVRLVFKNHTAKPDTFAYACHALSAFMHGPEQVGSQDNEDERAPIGNTVVRSFLKNRGVDSILNGLARHLGSRNVCVASCQLLQQVSFHTDLGNISDFSEDRLREGVVLDGKRQAVLSGVKLVWEAIRLHREHQPLMRVGTQLMEHCLNSVVLSDYTSTLLRDTECAEDLLNRIRVSVQSPVVGSRVSGTGGTPVFASAEPHWRSCPHSA